MNKYDEMAGKILGKTLDAAKEPTLRVGGAMNKVGGIGRNLLETWSGSKEAKFRKEDQARQDNAMQRMVKDMKMAGINPNKALGGSSGAPATMQTAGDQTTGIVTSIVDKIMGIINSDPKKIDEEEVTDMISKIING